MTEPEAPERAEKAAPVESREKLPLWAETLVLLLVAVVLAVVIKSFFLQAFYIPSPSMEPGLVRNDRILVEKVSYWGGGTPQRGDVVVFADPGSWLPPGEDDTATTPVTKALSVIGLYPSGGHLVKRVIGVGGDRVTCPDERGPLRVNGHPLDEASYLPDGTTPCATYGAFHVKVPDGDLWVMGDNRGDSADSRAHRQQPGGGFVSTDLVVGKVVALAWPLGRAGLIHRPTDFEDIPDPS